MTLQEAIIARHSVRQYETKPIEPEKIAQLQSAIGEANADGRLHLQLVTDEPEAFAAGLAKYGKFSGVSNYIALICRKGEDELLGYRAERIVLQAQTLGLNSCWVGLTFRKQPNRYTIADGETMHGVIALGYGKTQGVQHPPQAYREILQKRHHAPPRLVPSRCRSRSVGAYGNEYAKV